MNPAWPGRAVRTNVWHLRQMKSAFRKVISSPKAEGGFGLSPADLERKAVVSKRNSEVTLTHGDVVLAAITSCTNTSDPYVMLGAGLVAKKAVEKGLQVKATVKTSITPGSRVVLDYLKASGLSPFLEQLGFHIAGFGCATCIGNSGPLDEAVVKAITENDLVAAAPFFRATAILKDASIRIHAPITWPHPCWW